MMASATSSAARRAVSCVRQSIPGRGVASGRIQTASVQQVRVRCWCIALAWGFTPLSVFSARSGFSLWRPGFVVLLLQFSSIPAEPVQAYVWGGVQHIEH